ncbi:hypothetical protein AGR5A_Lc80015 [Agrobacterium genomosp. 5 str. CFBP 6626]|nr:hypothetical protein AGR5A_Lc80015 [Agrobacterium genomosp. 5 str. CFBP 6626]
MKFSRRSVKSSATIRRVKLNGGIWSGCWIYSEGYAQVMLRLVTSSPPELFRHAGLDPASS